VGYPEKCHGTRGLQFARVATWQTFMPSVGVSKSRWDGAKGSDGNVEKYETGRWLNNRAENSHQPFRRRE
jgi:transposase-like protein